MDSAKDKSSQSLTTHQISTSIFEVESATDATAPKIGHEQAAKLLPLVGGAAALMRVREHTSFTILIGLANVGYILYLCQNREFRAYFKYSMAGTLKTLTILFVGMLGPMILAVAMLKWFGLLKK